MPHPRYKYQDVVCFHCNIELHQRDTTYKRQQEKYGHSCCKHCFGKEQSFKDARSSVMLTNNPFKGKTHSEETKKHLSISKTGLLAWNKGLTKETNNSIALAAVKVSVLRKGVYIGANNPNWKGGVSKSPRYAKVPPSLKEWLAFRKTILERDVFSCWKCESDRRLEVHHLVSKTFHPELEYDELNCIVLCNPCHKQFHKKYGRKNFEPQNTFDWINSSREPHEKLVMC